MSETRLARKSPVTKISELKVPKSDTIVGTVLSIVIPDSFLISDNTGDIVVKTTNFAKVTKDYLQRTFKVKGNLNMFHEFIPTYIELT